MLSRTGHRMTICVALRRSVAFRGFQHDSRLTVKRSRLLRQLRDVDVSVLGEFPYRLRRVREERGPGAQQLLIPGEGALVIAHRQAREEVNRHAYTLAAGLRRQRPNMPLSVTPGACRSRLYGYPGDGRLRFVHVRAVAQGGGRIGW